MLAFYVSTGVVCLLLVGFYFAWTPLSVWYQKQQVPGGPDYLLDPDFERWDRNQLQAQAEKGNIEAQVKLAELKIRSCGGDEVEARLRPVLAKAPTNVKANLHYGVWLAMMRHDLQQAGKHLEVAAAHAPGLSKESIHAHQMLNWLAKVQKEKQQR
jgi:hypothetical protein